MRLYFVRFNLTGRSATQTALVEAEDFPGALAVVAKRFASEVMSIEVEQVDHNLTVMEATPPTQGEG